MRLGVRAVRNVALGRRSSRRTARGRAASSATTARSLARAVAAQSISRGRCVPPSRPEAAHPRSARRHRDSRARLRLSGRVRATPADHGRQSTRALRASRAPTLRDRPCRGRLVDARGMGAPRASRTRSSTTRSACRRATRRTSRGHPLSRPLPRGGVPCLTTENGEGIDWASLARGLGTPASELALAEDAFNQFCNAVIREWIEWGATLKVPAQKGVDVARIATLAAQQGAEPVQEVEAGRADIPDSAAPAATVSAPSSESERAPQASRSNPRGRRHAMSPPAPRASARQGRPQSPGRARRQSGPPTRSRVEPAGGHRRLDDARHVGARPVPIAAADRVGPRHLLPAPTGRDEEDRVVEAFDAGVDDFVAKPFNWRIRPRRGSRAARA